MPQNESPQQVTLVIQNLVTFLLFLLFLLLSKVTKHL